LNKQYVYLLLDFHCYAVSLTAVVMDAAAVVHDTVVAARLPATDGSEDLARNLCTRVRHALKLTSHAIRLRRGKTLLGK